METGKHEIDTNIEIKVEPGLLETKSNYIKSEQEVSYSSDLHIKRESPSFASVFIVQPGTYHHIKEEPAEDNFSEGDEFILPESSRLDAEGAWNYDSGVTSAGLDEACIKLTESNSPRHEDANTETFLADDKCKICGKCFNVASDLQTHVATHGGKKKHRCDICDKVFIRPCYLRRHTLTHIKRRKMESKCEICDRTFLKPSLLKRHSFVHGGIRPFQCEKCGKRFTIASNLSRHKLCHDGIRPYKCYHCRKAFTQASHLKEHNLIHGFMRPFKCNMCDKSFATQSTLKKHGIFHEETKSHKCEICEKSYFLASHLKIHKKKHEDKKV